MKKLYSFLILIVLASGSFAQEKTLNLTLDDVINIAAQSSIDAFRNKNMYRASYWEYRYYKADKLPTLSLDATPVSFNRYRSKDYNFQTNEDEFVLKESFSSDASLSLTQNIALTGGKIFLNSDLERVKNFSGDKNTSFKSTPISIGFSQQLNGYNELRWESKIEPLKFEKAKKEFIQSRESLAIKALGKFFDLVDAQIQLNIAETNMSSADTLYKIGKGRFQVGTVTQDELLTLQLNQLRAKQSLNAAKTSVQRYQSELNSFLGMDKLTVINCVIPEKIPAMQVNAGDAISKAIENNPDILDQRQRLLEQDKTVAKARSDAGFSTSLYALYGLDQSGNELSKAYKDPDNSQRFSVGVSIPIVDWGRRRGRYQMAQYNREVAKATINQERIDFEQEIVQNVMEFNLQAEQVQSAGLADTVAHKGYDVTLQRFMIGKVDVVKLNIARSDLETARRSYISAVRHYWNYYYTLRMKTLFDFTSGQTLSVQYDELLEK